MIERKLTRLSIRIRRVYLRTIIARMIPLIVLVALQSFVTSLHSDPESISLLAVVRERQDGMSPDRIEYERMEIEGVRDSF